MTRVLLTFESLHKLLAAEKSISELNRKTLFVRPTPTPPQFADTVCGMSLEILSLDSKDEILKHLKFSNLEPENIHEVTE